MEPSLQGDLTPQAGSATDIAPLGRTNPKPEHELTAAEDAQPVQWTAIAESAEFKELLRARLRFVVPATIFFVVYYFALLLLVGYFKSFSETKVFGAINIAYLFALSQFFMAWIMAAMYVKTAGRWDKMAAAIIAKALKR